jgi:hypothetical protein
VRCGTSAASVERGEEVLGVVGVTVRRGTMETVEP